MKQSEAGPIMVFIRHASPRIVAGVPPADWGLSTAGRRKCAALASRLVRCGLTRIVTSTEPKAAETGVLVAERLGLPVETAYGLQEQERRTARPFLSREAFAAEVAEAMRRPAEVVLGEESADDAHRRFAAAIRAVLRRHPGERLGVVTHGTVIALHVGRANLIDPVALWPRLGLPSFVVAVPPAYDLIEIVENV